MKKTALLLLLMTTLGNLLAKNVINVAEYVKKYGKKGDYTEAVRAAITAAKKGRTLYFPPGSYYINDTIDIRSLHEIYGRGKVKIFMNDPSKDIFLNKEAWRFKISGISFHGGRDQLSLGNRNLDKGLILVSDCRFKNASGAAIRFIRRDKIRTSSTLCIVDKCVMEYCTQALVAVSDHTVFKDSWVTSAKKNPENKAVIENHGTLVCTDILGVPLCGGNDLRWIDNYNSLTCRNFRFGGEFGGFTPVVNYAKFRKSLYGTSVVIEDSFTAALGNHKRQCVVYCEEIPNLIVIHNNMLCGIPAVKIAPEIKLESYFKGVRPGMLKVNISGNVGEFTDERPEKLLTEIKNLKSSKYDYGETQLSISETQKALALANIDAAKYPSSQKPMIMKYKVNNGKGHRQRTRKGEYRDINLKTNEWSLDDYLDGITEKCSSYLSVASAGDDIIILNRISPGKYPHVRIKNIAVDLNKTPYLTWNLKDNGVKGGHIAVKVIDNTTGKMQLLMERYTNPQLEYYAYDLRKILGNKRKEKVSIDVKFYLCGNRILASSGKNMKKEIKKGEYFLLDFMRLEKE